MIGMVKALVIGSFFAIVAGTIIGLISGLIGLVFGFGAILAGIAGGYGIKKGLTRESAECKPLTYWAICLIVGIVAFSSMYFFIMAEGINKELSNNSEFLRYNFGDVITGMLTHPNATWNLFSSTSNPLDLLFFLITIYATISTAGSFEPAPVKPANTGLKLKKAR